MSGIEEAEIVLETRDVSKVLEQVQGTVGGIRELLVIYTKADDINWQSNGLTISQLLYLMESVKFALFKDV